MSNPEHDNDAVVSMLKEQLKQMEESNKIQLNNVENIRLKYYMAAQELAKLKQIHNAILNENAKLLNSKLSKDSSSFENYENDLIKRRQSDKECDKCCEKYNNSTKYHHTTTQQQISNNIPVSCGKCCEKYNKSSSKSDYTPYQTNIIHPDKMNDCVKCCEKYTLISKPTTEKVTSESKLSEVRNPNVEIQSIQKPATFEKGTQIKTPSTKKRKSTEPTIQIIVPQKPENPEIIRQIEPLYTTRPIISITTFEPKCICNTRCDPETLVKDLKTTFEPIDQEVVPPKPRSPKIITQIDPLYTTPPYVSIKTIKPKCICNTKFDPEKWLVKDVIDIEPKTKPTTRYNANDCDSCSGDITMIKMELKDLEQEMQQLQDGQTNEARLYDYVSHKLDDKNIRLVNLDNSITEEIKKVHCECEKERLLELSKPKQKHIKNNLIQNYDKVLINYINPEGNFKSCSCEPSKPIQKTVSAVKLVTRPTEDLPRTKSTQFTPVHVPKPTVSEIKKQPADDLPKTKSTQLKPVPISKPIVPEIKKQPINTGDDNKPTKEILKKQPPIPKKSSDVQPIKKPAKEVLKKNRSADEIYPKQPDLQPVNKPTKEEPIPKFATILNPEPKKEPKLPPLAKSEVEHPKPLPQKPISLVKHETQHHQSKKNPLVPIQPIVRQCVCFETIQKFTQPLGRRPRVSQEFQSRPKIIYPTPSCCTPKTFVPYGMPTDKEIEYYNYWKNYPPHPLVKKDLHEEKLKELEAENIKFLKLNQQLNNLISDINKLKGKSEIYPSEAKDLPKPVNIAANIPEKYTFISYPGKERKIANPKTERAETSWPSQPCGPCNIKSKRGHPINYERLKGAQVLDRPTRDMIPSSNICPGPKYCSIEVNPKKQFIPKPQPKKSLDNESSKVCKCGCKLSLFGKRPCFCSERNGPGTSSETTKSILRHR